MDLTHNEQLFLLWATGTILTLFGGVIVYLMKSSVDRLNKIAESIGNIETDFRVLANDHDNLKSDHAELKATVRGIQIQLQKK